MEPRSAPQTTLRTVHTRTVPAAVMLPPRGPLLCPRLVNRGDVYDLVGGVDSRDEGEGTGPYLRIELGARYFVPDKYMYKFVS